MDTKIEGEKAIALAFTAYEQGLAVGRAEFTAPKLWEFKGHASRDTYFELRVCGQPSARALRNIIRQVELYYQFVAEDEAAEPLPAESGANSPSVDSASAGKGTRDEPKS